jgi:hypothetical protein
VKSSTLTTGLGSIMLALFWIGGLLIAMDSGASHTVVYIFLLPIAVVGNLVSLLLVNPLSALMNVAWLAVAFWLLSLE